MLRVNGKMRLQQPRRYISCGFNIYLVIAYLFFAICISVFISADMAFLLVMWALPSIIVVALDNGLDRYLSTSVLLCNFCGIIGYIRTFIVNLDRSSELIEEFMTNPKIWLYIYIWSALGWISYHFIPKVITLFLTYKLKKNIANLEEEIVVIKSEWGL